MQLRTDIIVIGAGQAGLALGYYLRRTPYTWVILDAEPAPGGAWRRGWDSLHLFSPVQWSPSYPGRALFRGIQIHSADYRTAELFAGRRVLIVGGGNSGAQILAEVSQMAETTWVTLDSPRFLPDDVDGRVLFERATARFTALQQGHDVNPPADLETS